MLRRDVFNQQKPYPLDQHVYQIFDRFQKLQQEVLDNWTQEAKSGAIVERRYQDFQDSRIEITPEGLPIIRICPFVGFDVLEEFSVYAKFFKLYRDLNETIVVLMTDIILENENIILWDHSVGTREEHETATLIASKKDHYGRFVVHDLVTTTKLLVTATNNDVVVMGMYTESLLEALYTDRNKLTEVVREIIDKCDLGEYFYDSNHHTMRTDKEKLFCFKHDTDLIQSYWRYVYKNLSDCCKIKRPMKVRDDAFGQFICLTKEK